MKAAEWQTYESAAVEYLLSSIVMSLSSMYWSERIIWQYVCGGIHLSVFWHDIIWYLKINASNLENMTNYICT